MVVSNSVVCRTCSNLNNGSCAEGELTGPNNMSECWIYRNKEDSLNLSNREGESVSYRLEGVFQF